MTMTWPKVGDELVVKSLAGVVRGFVTVEHVDQATGVVRMSKPVPARTVAGDRVEGQLPDLVFVDELHGLKRK